MRVRARLRCPLLWRLFDYFETGADNKVAAKALRVSVRSVERWRVAWASEGEQSLYSKGPASLTKLRPAQCRRGLGGRGSPSMTSAEAT
ncbi:helix-turn-helix domain-containing protein [Streptomyces pseudovenezuelae]|uniref:helix-turn-helix domain-containing protein n=1 Tax=Streptomyces pseudovenezuelae TaxID=67350 RepID=UPI0034A249FE